MKRRSNSLKKELIICLLTSPVIFLSFFAYPVLLSGFTKKVFAATMTNDEFQLKIDRTNDPLPTPQQTKVSKEKVKIAEQQNSIKANGSLDFSASTDAIDFGLLSPTSFTTRDLVFDLSRSTGNVAVLVQSENMLTSQDGGFIPQTTCDNGLCTYTTPSLWESTLTYGFGLRCNNKNGSLCIDDFLEKKTFIGLGNQKNNNPATLAKGIISDQDAQIIIEHKVNIPATQQPGFYQNKLTYFIFSMF